MALSHLRLVRLCFNEAKEALKKLKVIIENSKSENLPSIEFLVQAGKNAIECEDYEGLEFFAEVGLSIDESNIELCYLNGFALAKLGHKDEALEIMAGLLSKNISQDLREAIEEIIKSLE